MKAVMKVFAVSVLIFFSLGTVFSTQETITNFFKKEKPQPVYEFNQGAKKFRFVDAIGKYRVNNTYWDVVKEGSIESKNVELDLSNLISGEYIVEIEHEGYVFIENIEL